MLPTMLCIETSKLFGHETIDVELLAAILELFRCRSRTGLATWRELQAVCNLLLELANTRLEPCPVLRYQVVFKPGYFT